MKFFKNTLSIVALLAIGSMSAKSLKRTYAPSGPISQPMPKPLPQIPSKTPAPAPIVTRKITKADLLKDIENTQSSIKHLNDKFTLGFIESVKSSALSDQEKKELLNSGSNMLRFLSRNIEDNSKKINAALAQIGKKPEQTQQEAELNIPEFFESISAVKEEITNKDYIQKMVNKAIEESPKTINMINWKKPLFSGTNLLKVGGIITSAKTNILDDKKLEVNKSQLDNLTTFVKQDKQLDADIRNAIEKNISDTKAAIGNI